MLQSLYGFLYLYSLCIASKYRTYIHNFFCLDVFLLFSYFLNVKVFIYCIWQTKSGNEDDLFSLIIQMRLHKGFIRWKKAIHYGKASDLITLLFFFLIFRNLFHLLWIFSLGCSICGHFLSSM